MDVSAELRAAIQAVLNEPRTNGRHAGPIAPPRELCDPNIAPEKRAHALEAYTAAVMEVPNNYWDAAMKAAVKEQCAAVLVRGW
jgi:hypothetical protein